MAERTAPDRDLVIDTMASWALEGMEPDQQTLEDINALVAGVITAEEFQRRTQALAAHG